MAAAYGCAIRYARRKEREQKVGKNVNRILCSMAAQSGSGLESEMRIIIRKNPHLKWQDEFIHLMK